MRKEYDFSRGRRGAVVAPRPGKTRITIRVDDDILEWFWRKVDEAGGGNYQTMINDVLRHSMEASEEGLEDTLRRVVREEVMRMKASFEDQRAANTPPAQGRRLRRRAGSGG
jgi:predicted DNA binding CopG/RHH family protein